MRNEKESVDTQLSTYVLRLHDLQEAERQLRKTLMNMSSEQIQELYDTFTAADEDKETYLDMLFEGAVGPVIWYCPVCCYSELG